MGKEAEKKNVEKKEFELLGKPLTYNEDTNEFRMARGDYENILNDLGATPEVRAIVTDAINKVAEEMLPILKDQVISTGGNAQKAKLSSGNWAIDLRMKGHQVNEGVTPGTKKPYRSETYGQSSMSLTMNLGRKLRAADGLCARCSEEIERALKGK